MKTPQEIAEEAITADAGVPDRLDEIYSNTYEGVRALIAEAIKADRAQRDTRSEYIDIVLDGPPDHESGRFVEIEDSSGASVKVDEWIERDGGYWALRIRTSPDAGKPEPTHKCGFCGYPFPAEEGDPDGCKYAKCMICGSEDDWEPIEGTSEIFPGTQSALDALCEAAKRGELS